jgi:hypothetical protein
VLENMPQNDQNVTDFGQIFVILKAWFGSASKKVRFGPKGSVRFGIYRTEPRFGRSLIQTEEEEKEENIFLLRLKPV